jgi:hypothetical protein
VLEAVEAPIGQQRASGSGLNPVLIGAQVLDFARPSQKSFSSPASEGPIGAWAKCTSGLPANAHYRNSIEA